MGKTLVTAVDANDTTYEFEVTYSRDGESWESRMFEDLGDARRFALGILRGGGLMYARRLLQVSTADFFECEPSDMHVIQRCPVMPECN